MSSKLRDFIDKLRRKLGSGPVVVTA